MKGIVLTQPWAQLVALGAKKIETRNWRTPYRGPLAIMAGKGLGGIRRPDGAPGREDDLNALCASEPFATALFRRWGADPNITFGGDLPRGQVVAVVDLVDIRTTEQLRAGMPWAAIEFAFGNYDDGRYGWMLADVRPVEPLAIPRRAVPCYQGLWDVPLFIATELEAQLAQTR